MLLRLRLSIAEEAPHAETSPEALLNEGDICQLTSIRHRPFGMIYGRLKSHSSISVMFLHYGEGAKAALP